MAALIPPAAATECERTGWTFERMPTVAPASAAARAARWPARPAPMMRTSCAGIEAPDCIGGGSATRCRGQRAADLVDRDDAAEDAVAIDGEDGAQPAQALGAEKRLERLVDLDLQVVAVADDVAHRQRRT